MQTPFKAIALAAALLAMPVAALAQAPDNFTTGPIITDYGKVADVPAATPLAETTRLKVAFDVVKAADTGKANRSLDSVARFLNLHARAGVAPENISAAIVVHGPAANDLLIRKSNKSVALISALIDAGVTIQLCGQTAAYRGIRSDDLLPGVTLSHSAMTAHALLQQDGFTLNPF